MATQLSVSEVVERLVDAAERRASRSSGPGGQHRDKASTRAELVVSLDSLGGLDADVADRQARIANAAGNTD